MTIKQKVQKAQIILMETMAVPFEAEWDPEAGRLVAEGQKKPEKGKAVIHAACQLLVGSRKAPEEEKAAVGAALGLYNEIERMIYATKRTFGGYSEYTVAMMLDLIRSYEEKLPKKCYDNLMDLFKEDIL